MDTQTEVSVLHFIGTDGGDWLLAFGVRLDRRSGVNDAPHQSQVRGLAKARRRRYLQGLSGVRRYSGVG